MVIYYNLLWVFIYLAECRNELISLSFSLSLVVHPKFRSHWHSLRPTVCLFFQHPSIIGTDCERITRDYCTKGQAPTNRDDPDERKRGPFITRVLFSPIYIFRHLSPPHDRHLIKAPQPTPTTTGIWRRNCCGTAAPPSFINHYQSIDIKRPQQKPQPPTPIRIFFFSSRVDSSGCCVVQWLNRRKIVEVGHERSELTFHHLLYYAWS